MEKMKEMFMANIRQYAMMVALIFIVILFQYLTEGVLLRPLNITNIIQQNSYILILAIGMLLCILTGNIDLSVGSVAAFIGAVAATMVVTWKWPVLPSVLLALLLGVAIGCWQGYWIAYFRIPAFIVTLAGMLCFRGLTLVMLRGQTIAPMPQSFQKSISTFIPDVLGGADLNYTALAVVAAAILAFAFADLRSRRKKIACGFDVLSFPLWTLKILTMGAVLMAFSWQLARHRGLPVVLVLLGSLVLIYSFITGKTVFGRHVYAFGGNEKAAKLSGIDTNRVFFLVYANMGLLAAVAGLVFMGRLNAASPMAGTNFELDAIGACYIGGASASGGIGTVAGAIIGGLIMGILNNGMSIVGVSIDWQQVVKGLVLLGAVAFDVYTKRRTAR